MVREEGGGGRWEQNEMLAVFINHPADVVGD